jgi:hypothetical protein
LIRTLAAVEVRGGCSQWFRKCGQHVPGSMAVSRLAMLQALDLIEHRTDRMTTLGWCVAGELAAGRRVALHGCGDAKGSLQR